MKGRIILAAVAGCILSFTICTPSSSYAQTPVTVSREIVRVSGKLMYAHGVKKGETLYSICKVYGVTAEELQKDNPLLAGGLKDGMLLYIPVNESTAKTAGSTAKRDEENATGIKRGTIGKEKSKKVQNGSEAKNSSESKSSNEAKSTATAKNPAAYKNTDASRNTDASKDSAASSKNTAASGEKYIVHEVKWYEVLDDISAEYHVSKEVLKKENNIKDETLKGIKSIRIPLSSSTTSAAAAATSAARAAEKKSGKQDYTSDNSSESSTTNHYGNANTGNRISNNSNSNTNTGNNTSNRTGNNTGNSNTNTGNSNTDTFSTGWIQTGEEPKSVEISYILPLNSRNSTGPNSNYMDFYAGALMAAKNLNTDGKQMTVNVIDQSSYSSSKAIINSGKLNGSSMIIGPSRSKDISSYISYINKHHIPMVSPLDPSADSLLSKSSYLLQVPSDARIQLENLVMLAVNSSRDAVTPNLASITVIYQEGGSDRWVSNIVREKLRNEGVHFSEITYSILQGKKIAGRFNELIASGKDNIVIVPSNNEAFVSDVLRNLSILELKEGNIRLYGTSRWRSFDAVDITLFNRFSLTLAMPYYINLSDEKVQSFTREFRAMFNKEPSANAFSGYDVTLYFATELMLGHLSNLSDIQDLPEKEMLQQHFSFKRQENNFGFKNTATTNISYNPDYSVSILNNH